MEDQFEEALSKVIHILTKHSNNVLGKVVDLDSTEFTCTIKVDQSLFYNVPLRVLIGSQASNMELPVSGSHVLICFKDGNNQSPQILAIDQTDKWLINCNLVEYNKGTFGGLVKVVELTSKLNRAEKELNDLKILIASWSPVPNDGGASLKSLLSAWSAMVIVPTVRTEIEDKKITH